MNAPLFEAPEWWPVCAAALAFAAFALAFAHWRASAHLRRLVGAGAARLASGGARDALLLAALAAVAAALLAPRIAERSVHLSSTGVDAVVLLDVSRSMDARDQAPSRIARARRALDGLLAGLGSGDRVALAAFAGRGALFTPLTHDREALRELVPALDTDLLRPGGSRLDLGLRSAISAFEPESLRPRVAIVLSDGEGESDIGAVANEALRAELRVIALAFGSEEGSVVPDRGAKLLDEYGKPVLSRRQLARLAALANATDGSTFAADAWGEVDLEGVVSAVRRDAVSLPGESREVRRLAGAVTPFAALAFALLWLEAVPWRRVGRKPAASTALGLALVAATALSGARALGADDGPAERVAALEAVARTRPLEPSEHLALGVARARVGRWAEAEHSFRAAALLADDPTVAALGWYDLGVSALERGELEEARDWFFDALAHAPRDRRTQFNLEWTLRALAESDAEDPESQGPPSRPESDSQPQGESEEPDPRAESDAPGTDAEAEGRTPGAGGRQAEPHEPEPDPVPELTERGRKRWLERTRDDPARALRAWAAVADDQQDAQRERYAPTW